MFNRVVLYFVFFLAALSGAQATVFYNTSFKENNFVITAYEDGRFKNLDLTVREIYKKIKTDEELRVAIQRDLGISNVERFLGNLAQNKQTKITKENAIVYKTPEYVSSSFDRLKKIGTISNCSEFSKKKDNSEIPGSFPPKAGFIRVTPSVTTLVRDGKPAIVSIQGYYADGTLIEPNTTQQLDVEIAYDEQEGKKTLNAVLWGGPGGGDTRKYKISGLVETPQTSLQFLLKHYSNIYGVFVATVVAPKIEEPFSIKILGKFSDIAINEAVELRIALFDKNGKEIPFLDQCTPTWGTHTEHTQIVRQEKNVAIIRIIKPPTPSLPPPQVSVVGASCGKFTANLQLALKDPIVVHPL